MATKLIDNSRRTHAAKVLAESSRKNAPVEESVVRRTRKKESEGGALEKQYKIIRNDILKLREDLAHGYDLLKEWLETKISRRTLEKS